MSDRIDKSVPAFVSALTGLTEPEVEGFLRDIDSNRGFNEGFGRARGSGSESYPSWGVGPDLGKALYAICRAKRPAVVVETGVASGVSSSYILQALEDNGQGTLCSIDEPSWETDTGWAIPYYLRHRWRLIKGRSSRMLPPVVSEFKQIGLFLHDSEHSYRNMMWEFKTAWACLDNGGVLLSHNIDTNRAFDDFSKDVHLEAHRLEDLGGLLKPGKLP